MVEDFFSGVEQFRANVGGQEAATPTFYRDARSITLVMAANLRELKSQMPDPRYVPAQLMPGVGAVTLTALEYFDTDIGPYNEFSIGIALNSERFLPLPCYNMLRQALTLAFDSYILHLPVTTEVAMRGGVELYNYPKFMAGIDFEDSDDWLSCELHLAGELICRVRGRKVPATRKGVIRNYCRLYQFGQPQCGEFKVHARKYGAYPGPSNADVVVAGGHPVGLQLAALLRSTTPLGYVYVPSMEAILYGPEHLSLAGIALFMERGLGLSLGDLAGARRGTAGAAKPPRKKAAGKAGKKAAGKAGKKAAAKARKAAGKKP